MHIRIFIYSIILFLPLLVFGQTAYPGWTHNAVITLNTTPTGADLPVTATATDFPLMVRLEKGNFDFSQAKTGGEDIRFSSGANAPLKYQIELWDAALGKAVIWVKVPAIQGNATQTLYLYWGNSAATSESDGSAVFETANGFTGVWHLDDTPGNNAENYKDATGNVAHGTGNNLTAEAGAWGILGKGTQFDRTKFQYIAINDEALFDFTTSMTASFWLKTRDVSGGVQFVVSKSNNAKINIQNDGTRFNFGFNGPKGAGNAWAHLNVPIDPPGILDGRWHQVSLVFQGSVSSTAYFDGQKAGQLTDVIESIGLNNSPVFIGGSGYSSWQDWSFDGILDEVRYESALRDSNWIKLSFENQKIDQTFASAPLEAGCTENFGVPQSSVTGNEGVPFTVSGNAVCADRFHWVEVDGGGNETLLDAGLNVVRTIFRLSADSVMTWRLKALYGTEWRTADVTVTVKDIIPNPIFTMTTTGPQGTPWNGRGDIEIIPVISNKAEIEALNPPAGGAQYNVINFNWTITGAPTYKTFTDTSLILNKAYINGTSTVELCLDNSGEVICHEIAHEVELPAITPHGPFPGTPGKLKVFVLAGQSNMEGYGWLYENTGTTYPQQNGTLPWLLASSEHAAEFEPLVDGNDVPLEFDDTWVYYPRMNGDTAVGVLSPKYGVSHNASTNQVGIGPEYGIGLQLGEYLGEQVLLVKAAYGGAALAVQPGNHFHPPGAQGETGNRYESMLAIVEDVTANLKSFFPDYDDSGYEIAGFGWFQGWNDGLQEYRVAEYAENLAILIDDVRKDLGVPLLPFVIAETGNMCDGKPEFCDAQAAVLEFPDFKENIAVVETRDFDREDMAPWGPQYGSHWHGSFWSYYKIGDAMGTAMVELLENSDTSVVPVQNTPMPFEVAVSVTGPSVILKISYLDNYELIVSNIKGRIVKSFRINNSREFSFLKTALQNGVYTIRLRSGRGEWVKRLVLM